LAVVIAGVAVAALAAMVFMFLQTSGEKDDADEALAAAETELSQMSADLATSEQRAAELQDDLAASQRSASSLQAEVDDSQESLEGAKDQLVVAAEAHQGVSDFLATSFTMGTGLTKSEGRCLAEWLLEARSVPNLLGALTGLVSAPAEADVLALAGDLLSAAGDCGIPPEALGTQLAYSYGDDPALDALYDECTNGSSSSCDELFFASPVGSEYEAYAVTCGERFSHVEAPFRCEGSI
jgi:multidrug efflux pump subunit AcrA (membrane-fusion protein)